LPKIKYRPLRPGEWALLYEIFRCNRGGILATRSELAKRLRISIAAVDRLIYDLRKVSKKTYVLSRSVKRKLNGPSAKHTGSARPVCHYVLAEDNLITEPATAILVANLRRYPRTGEKMVNRNLFAIDTSARLGIKRVVVEELIEKAIARKYVLETDPLGRHIVEAERTLYEEKYLRLLARHRQGAP
jgi:hypothetical protein